MKASYPKFLLRKIGEHVSRSQLYALQGSVNYLRLGRWMRDHGFHFDYELRDRWAIFDMLAAKVQEKRVLYMEFGVFRGRSTRYWSGKLKNPESRLHGFDSFEGLPEEWGPLGDTRFNVAGKVPVIPDPRVQFFKGWFNEVLPTYVVPDHDQLVVNLDADLYSSTAYVLHYLRPHIHAGTLVYFDEMNHVEHEPRAFDEFMKETSLTFKPICADRSLSKACFECVG